MLEVMTADSAPRNSVAEAPSAARWASIDELLERAHVVALPLRVPFRGVQVREALLFDAPSAGLNGRPSWNMNQKKLPGGYARPELWLQPGA